MEKIYYDNMAKITAGVGMDLVRVSDEYRAKEAYCPISEASDWIEATQLEVK